MKTPFDVDSSHIGRLNPEQLTQVLRYLLHAEAQEHGIAQNSVEVSSNIYAADGGEDGRISWKGGPERTDYLPNRLTIFQSKTGEMRPAGYAKEITTTAGIVKTQIEKALNVGGSYIVFTSQELTTSQKKDRITAMKKELRTLKKDYADNCVLRIYDAAQIAEWANQFPSIGMLIQQWHGNNIAGFMTFDYWKGYDEFSKLPFVDFDTRRDIIKTCQEKLRQPKFCGRIVGLSGLGKTRTAFQIFNEEENSDLKYLLAYANANIDIPVTVRKWVNSKRRVILLVDNCPYELHEALVREVTHTDSKISLLTLDYDTESVWGQSEYFTLKPLKNEEILQLLNQEYENKLPDLNRLATFADGFPGIAALLVEARLSKEEWSGELTPAVLIKKLLWRHGEPENENTLEILQTCSLFDIFGIDGEGKDELEHIAKVEGIAINQIYKCIKIYSKRGLIDRRGHWGRVIPQPLAIHLAKEWWEYSREEKQAKLLENIPPRLFEKFCWRMETIDNCDNICIEKLLRPPNYQEKEEYILSEVGSRLFLALVRIDHKRTSKIISRALKELDGEQLRNISSTVRSNLVSALEKLCFHADTFKEAARCMFLFATTKSTSHVGSATNLFAQLFQIFLSATGAPPEERFSLLEELMESPDRRIKKEQADMVLLEALNRSLNVSHATRFGGAAYQGMKPPLEEWKPEIGKDAFDYLQRLLNYMLELLERGDAQKERALKSIGSHIGSLLLHGLRVPILDGVIRRIVDINGPYWPNAVTSIIATLRQDTLSPENKKALNTWLDMLSPEKARNILEKLKIVVDSSFLYFPKDDENPYLDKAAEDIKKLASEIATNIDDLIPHLNVLLEGEARQAYPFGFQLSQELSGNVDRLLNASFDHYVGIEQGNLSFIRGMYRGIFEQSEPQWQKHIDKVLNDKRLAYLYPDLICTGTIKKLHLDRLLDLYRSGIISLNKVHDLANYIRFNISDEIVEFCLSLAEMDVQAAGVAVNIIYEHYPYLFSTGEKNNVKHLRLSIQKLILSMPMYVNTAGWYGWPELVTALLKDTGVTFARNLATHIIDGIVNGSPHNYSYHNEHIKTVFENLVRDYNTEIWSILADRIVHAEGIEYYRLRMLFNQDLASSNDTPSIFSLIDAEYIMDWCSKFPKRAPQFLAGCLNIFEMVKNQRKPTALFISLLEHFGDDDTVSGELHARMGTGVWVGSRIPYLESDKDALSSLLNHTSKSVRNWVKDYLGIIDRQIESASKSESLRDWEYRL